MRQMWEEVWMSAEQQYVEIEEPYTKANLVIDGSGEEISILSDRIRITNR